MQTDEEAGAMATFHSILFARPEQRVGVDERDPPEFFKDLNLDQVVRAITAGRQEYRLEPFFYTLLRDADAIAYRHEILRDLEDRHLRERVGSFAQHMRAMREHLAQADKLYYKYQQEAWFLEAVRWYCEAVSRLQRDLSGAVVGSRGLRAFREYLSRYVESPAFTTLVAEMTKVMEDLSAVTYSLLIRDDRITVGKYDGEADYAAEVKATFQKFQRGAPKDYLVEFPACAEMNHIEAAIVDRVALLWPDVFQALDRFCARHQAYLDQTIAGFDREVQFYVAVLEYVDRFRTAGLSFCYPVVSDRSKEIFAADTFDVALAGRLVGERAPVVCNDFFLNDPERIFIVTGPNQGGKTTFARMFGQLHYLASIGCLVPGRAARLFLFDALYTHFEREEDPSSLRGKLEDDLLRIHDILSRATPNSIVIMNEIFTSTTLEDALVLSRKVLERLIQLDLLAVCVTFVDELASLSPATVSVVSTVSAADPAVRTYKIVRKPADGRAYAVAIAEKYGLTYERLRQRVRG
jgi:hypothetical protein